MRSVFQGFFCKHYQKLTYRQQLSVSRVVCPKDVEREGIVYCCSRNFLDEREKFHDSCIGWHGVDDVAAARRRHRRRAGCGAAAAGLPDRAVRLLCDSATAHTCKLSELFLSCRPLAIHRHTFGEKYLGGRLTRAEGSDLYDYEPEAGIFAAEVLAGLQQTVKTIAPKYFYDERGSQLFDASTQLPEYYPTRTEKALLVDVADEISRVTGAEELVELGAGAARRSTFLNA